jgi:hypothetical protein
MLYFKTLRDNNVLGKDIFSNFMKRFIIVLYNKVKNR